MQPWDIIEKLESDNSRLYKEAIIDDERNNKIFMEGLRYALDPMITFGVKKIKEKKREEGYGVNWNVFVDLLDNLSSRRITGNAAIDAIDAMMEQASMKQWNNWYRRILIKDLRCGVSEKTVNNVIPNSIPVFSCQLAQDSAGREIAGEFMVEVKLDGVRVITIVYPDGRVDQYSRNGKELVNFEHVKNQFALVADTLSEPMVFDGEIMSDSFQDLMKQVYRKSDVKTEDAVLHLFDFLSLKDFNNGRAGGPQLGRSQNLKEWYEENQEKLPNVKILAYEVLDMRKDSHVKRFHEINKKAIEGGYEGIMIKDINAPYQCKRTKSWLKLKPFIEVSLEVINVEEGTGRNVGKLGALVCAGQDDGKSISVNVGSGFSDSDRDNFYRDRNNVIGKIVEVRADAITQNQDGTYSLRFPRFLRFRGFENGEKL